MLILKVPEMGCGVCVSTIQGAVRQLDPSATLSADLASKLVTIESSIDVARISDAIEKAGYRNVPVE